MVVRGCRVVRQTAQRTTRSLVRQLVSVGWRVEFLLRTDTRYPQEAGVATLKEAEGTVQVAKRGATKSGRKNFFWRDFIISFPPLFESNVLGEVDLLLRSDHSGVFFSSIKDRWRLISVGIENGKRDWEFSYFSLG